MTKCKRCRGRAELQLRAHNAAFCRPCFFFFFERQVERTIARYHMFAPGERILVAVSGGKDSLALWHLLVAQGYDTLGLHLSLGIGSYSAASRAKTEAFAAARGLRLVVKDLSLLEEDVGIPTIKAFTNRPACAACGLIKRHLFDAVALEHGQSAIATGHNLDDEAARLLGNVLHWQRDYLAKQRPVLEPTHPKFVKKVRPLFLISEFETAAYAFFRGIDYVVDECPNSVGATQLTYKAHLNRLEHDMPGTKHTFVREFMRSGQPAFAAVEHTPPGECARCGMPSFAAVCSYCHLLAEVSAKRERARAAV
jgi:uncharacterized protein (TIGR00269 family)